MRITSNDRATSPSREFYTLPRLTSTRRSISTRGLFIAGLILGFLLGLLAG